MRSPHEWAAPDEREMKRPVGASVCPLTLWPQQEMVPSVRKPQEKVPSPLPQPVETARKVPGGASACPKLFSPQQTMVWSVRTAQECALPTETNLNEPSGNSTGPNAGFSPQHLTQPL